MKYLTTGDLPGKSNKLGLPLQVNSYACQLSPSAQHCQVHYEHQETELNRWQEMCLALALRRGGRKAVALHNIPFPSLLHIIICK